jgi:hypothetical protein
MNACKRAKRTEAIKNLEAKGVTFRETDRQFFYQVQPVWQSFQTSIRI